MALGVVLIVVGLIPPVAAFARFARAGGTPMPLAPTTHLVVQGFNRYVRSPMYAGLLVVIVGQALLVARWELRLYAAFFWAVTAAFVRWYEEPTLVRQYGAEYEAHRRAVPLGSRACVHGRAFRAPLRWWIVETRSTDGRSFVTSRRRVR